MGFYLSPQVAVQEIDLSTTIPAVATSIAVLALRDTYKGQEKKKLLITDEDTLISTFGEPTTESYRDIFSGIGYLKYGNKLYCTRVLPEDATFSGTLATSGYSTSADSFQGIVESGQDPFNYDNLETGDPDEFTENNLIYDDSNPFSLIAESRGAWGNKLRVIAIDKPLYDELKGKTITPELSATAATWITDYNDGTLAEKETMTYQAIYEVDEGLVDNYSFLLIVQAQAQNSNEWQTVEVHNVSTKENAISDDGVSLFAENYINQNSNYIRIDLNDVYIDKEITIGTKYYEYLKDGSNGTGNATDSDIIEAYELYANNEEIDVNLFIDGGKSENIKLKLIEICETTRKDSFAILDVPKEKVINQTNIAESLRQWRSGLGGSTFNPNTSYAALYGNWIEVFDKYSNKYRWVPFSGYAAGLYARTDEETEPWFAPAGLNRTVLTNVRRLAWNPQKGERDILFSNGINPVISMAGKGKVIWGDKTLLAKSSAFDAINVRRLFLVLEKAIAAASKWFLFEQNDAITRLQLINMIEPFLRDVKARRGIYEFKVVCDETINTGERIDRGELWTDIIVKPTRSVRYIVLRFAATKTGANLEEIATQLAG